MIIHLKPNRALEPKIHGLPAGVMRNSNDNNLNLHGSFRSNVTKEEEH